MTHIKARCSGMHMEPILKGEDRHIARTCWQYSLAEMADIRFVKRTISQKLRWRGNGQRHLNLIFPHVLVWASKAV